MNFPLFAARRYLFSEGSTNVINVISIISTISVAVTTMVLVIVTSVFSSFHDLMASFLTSFDPQLKVVPTEGRSANTNDPLLTKVEQPHQVDVATEDVKDIATTIYGDKLTMVTVKGVDDNFDKLTRIEEILYDDGEYELHAGNLGYNIIGIRLAQALDVGVTWSGYLKIYTPRRSGQLDVSNPASGFAIDSLLSPGVVFSVNQARYDKGRMLTSIEFAHNLFDMKGHISSLELRLQKSCNLKEVKKEIQTIVGSRCKVLDHFEQQTGTFKIMQVEKIIAYFFLMFILIVVCFDITGSLSMLMIGKKNNVMTLRNIGTNDKQITKVFLFEGRMVSVIGALVGILLGLLLCWLQQAFGFVLLRQRSGDFVVNTYPVSVYYLDILFILITVIAIGQMAVWHPVRYFSKRLLTNH